MPAEDVWRRVIEGAGAYARAVFQRCDLVELHEGRAVVEVKDARSAGVVRAQAGEIARAIGGVVGRAVEVDVRAPEAGPDAAPARAANVDAELRREAEAHPSVKRAMDLFGARIVSVERSTPDDEG